MGEKKISEVRPYNDSREKKIQVEEMFDNIAPQYDRLNQILSLGIHRSWRKKAVQLLTETRPNRILDLATGTGDFAIELARNGSSEITASDISEGMMEIGRKKIVRLGLSEKIQFLRGDAEQLPYANDSFDGISIAFGVRNFQDLRKGLQEMYRVLRPGGKVVILEFSKVKGWFKPFYNFYFRFILPVIGRIFSRDASAYSYLPDSVRAFPSGDEFLSVLSACGYHRSEAFPRTFGAATIYVACKPE